MKEKVFVNDQLINSQLSELNNKIPYIQELVDRYNSLSIGELENEELHELFQNPKDFISKKLTGGQKLKVGGLTANPEKLLDIIEKPSGLDEFISLMMKHNSDKRKIEFYRINNYLIEKGKVVLSELTKESIRETHTVYLENAQQKNIYECTHAIASKLNRIKQLTGGQFNLEHLFKYYLKRAPRKEGEPNSDYADIIVNTDILKQFK